MSLTQEQAAILLRKPFAADQVGKLPKISCRACSKAPGKVCQDHSKKKCQACGNYLTTAHVDLDYVGHAGVTARLLEADPAWTWEPLSIGADGVPVINVANGEATMWVRMTVNGVTRIGVGSAPANSFELHKQLISDAIRNVAMRFGVALDLWSKEPLPEVTEIAGEVSGGSPFPLPAAPSPAPTAGGEREGEEGAAPRRTAPASTSAPGGGADSPAPSSGSNADDASAHGASPSGPAPTPDWFPAANRRARAIASGVLSDDKPTAKAQWEALVWMQSGGTTTASKELSQSAHGELVRKLGDVSAGKGTLVETDDPACLGWTIAWKEAA